MPDFLEREFENWWYSLEEDNRPDHDEAWDIWKAAFKAGWDSFAEEHDGWKDI